MSHAAPSPVYRQLHGKLRELAASEFADGDRFLTERQVSERFGVSRPTANKALFALVSEGLLEFRTGAGTFVRKRPLDYNLRALVSFNEEAHAAGREPSTEVLGLDKLAAGAAPGNIASLLRAAPGDLVWYVTRLRLADGVPMILEKRYVVARFCTSLTWKDVGGSLYRVWQQKFGLELSGAHQAIRAVSIHGSEAELLKVPQGAAGFLILSVGFLADGAPLWYEHTLYRGDMYEFRNQLTGVQPAAHAVGRFLASGGGS
ncbi:MAG: GntR family transcriptional regulator [Bryobacterales bacterium]|nr:GntR family transcriptional regulator [Bryobacterales bacterium]